MINFLIASDTLDMFPEDVKGKLHLIVTPNCMAPLALYADREISVHIAECMRPVAIALNLIDLAGDENEMMIYTNIPEIEAAFKSLNFKYKDKNYHIDSSLLKKTARKRVAAQAKQENTEEAPAKPRKPRTRKKKTESVEEEQPAVMETAPAAEPVAEAEEKTENFPMNEPEIMIPEEEMPVVSEAEERAKRIKEIVIGAIHDASDKTIGLPIVLSTRLAAEGIMDPGGRILSEAREKYDFYKNNQEK